MILAMTVGTFLSRCSEKNDFVLFRLYHQIYIYIHVNSILHIYELSSWILFFFLLFLLFLSSLFMKRTALLSYLGCHYTNSSATYATTTTTTTAMYHMDLLIALWTLIVASFVVLVWSAFQKIRK